jgi:hypothetical protein
MTDVILKKYDPRFGFLAWKYCHLELPLQVLRSGAGWYIGTEDEEGPVSRESQYFAERELAEMALASRTWTQRLTP